MLSKDKLKKEKHKFATPEPKKNTLKLTNDILYKTNHGQVLFPGSEFRILVCVASGRNLDTWLLIQFGPVTRNSDELRRI